MAYVDGFVLAVPTARKDEYIAHATKAAEIFRELGMTRLVECWGDDVHRGKTTDFFMAVKAKEDETVVFSWMEWPSRDAHDAAMKKMETDPRFKEMGEMPFDGKRMIFGGFVPVVDL